MPSQVVVDLPSATIASGGTDSNAVTHLDDAVSISIFAPATLTGTVTLYVEPSSTGTSFVIQYSGGSAVTIPAGANTTLFGPSFRQLKLISNGAEGADRTFRITKSI